MYEVYRKSTGNAKLKIDVSIGISMKKEAKMYCMYICSK